MSDEQNGNGTSRLDRMEGLMQLLIDDHLKFSHEHNRLLTAQVVLVGRMDKLAETMEGIAQAQIRAAQAQIELAESQKHTDQRMDALIAVVDGLIRRPPPDSTAN
jgi:hypothetical protein